MLGGTTASRNMRLKKVHYIGIATGVLFGLLIILSECSCSKSSGPKPNSEVSNVATNQNADLFKSFEEGKFYLKANAQLLARDDKHIYKLIAPQFDQGDGRAIPEKWIRIDGSSSKYYMRALSSYKDETIMPIFIPW